MIDPFKLKEAEELYPIPGFSQWWWDRFSANSVTEAYKWFLVIFFLGFNVMGIVCDQIQWLALRNLLLILANIPLAIVVITGFVAVFLKFKVLKKRIIYMGCTPREYNELIKKLEK